MVEEIPDYVSAPEAARRLGITTRRVYALIADGRLRSARAGERILVRVEDVDARARNGGATGGHPFSPRRAWALILMASGQPVPWLDTVTRSKLRRVIADRNLWFLRSKLGRRAERRFFRAHSSDLSRLEQESGAIRTGARAAAAAGLDLLANDARLELYVDRSRADELARRYALRPSPAPNVVLRVVPNETFWWLNGPVAPRAAVALDLAEDEDARSQQVAREMLSGR